MTFHFMGFPARSMSSVLPKPGRSAGFSLAEALVALALAAILAAVLTRFVSTTRLNAFKIREQVAIDVLSDSLVERVAAHQWQAGRSDGRSGRLVWRVDVTPTAFYAHARSIKPKKKKSNESANGGTALGLAAISDGSDDETKEDETKFAAKGGPATTAPAVAWIPYRVTTVVSAPSGRSHVVNTIRFGPEQGENPTETGQR